MKKKNKRDALLRDQMVIKRVLMSNYENDLFKTALKKIHNLLLYNKATLKKNVKRRSMIFFKLGAATLLWCKKEMNKHLEAMRKDTGLGKLRA
jgi:hypothetical protein